MGFVLKNGRPLARPVVVGAPAAPAVLQDRVIGTYGHSLWNWGDAYGVVPLWMTRMAAQDAGKTIQAAHTFNTVPGNTPPEYDRTMAEVTTPPGDFTTWVDTDAANFTDKIIMIDNHTAPPVINGYETDPRLGGQLAYSGPVRLPVEHFVDLISRYEAGTSTPDIKYWIFECHGFGNGLINEDGTSSAANFAAWRLRTTTAHGHNQWYDDLLADVRSDLPALASRIGKIPVSRVLVDVMENSAASSMTSSTDWFADRAPHGQHGTYALTAAIVWSSLYGEAAPEPSFAGSNVHATIQNNWASIAAHIAAGVAAA